MEKVTERPVFSTAAAPASGVCLPLRRSHAKHWPLIALSVLLCSGIAQGQEEASDPTSSNPKLDLPTFSPLKPSSPPSALKHELEEAITAYERGGYLAAAARLSALLYPLKLTDRKDIVLAKSHLGMCYYVLGRREDAAVEFRGVFRVDETWKPDPLKVPPELMTFIERLRPAPERAAPVPGLGEALQNRPNTTSRFSPKDLIPFGVPQLLRGEYGRGIALATVETSCLAANLASYWFLKANTQSPPADDAAYGRLQLVRGVNYASLGLLVVTAVLGAGDALVQYEPVAQLPAQSLELRLMPVQHAASVGDLMVPAETLPGVSRPTREVTTMAAPTAGFVLSFHF